VIDKAGTNIFPPSILFSLASITPPILHTHFHLLVILSRGTNGRRLLTFQTAKLFWEIGENEILKYVQLIFVSVETIKINVTRPACKAQSTLSQYNDKD